MAIYNLELEHKRTLEAIISWAQTNKDYSDMREQYIFYLELLSNGQVYKKDNLIGRIFLKSVPSKLKEQAAPSLSKAQQHKLSVILRRITSLIPKPEPRKSKLQPQKNNK